MLESPFKLLRDLCFFNYAPLDFGFSFTFLLLLVLTTTPGVLFVVDGTIE